MVVDKVIKQKSQVNKSTEEIVRVKFRDGREYQSVQGESN